MELWEEEDEGAVKVNSKGHCLLCLANLNPLPGGPEFRAGSWEQKPVLPSPSVTSLQRLSKYLRIDVRSRLIVTNNQSQSYRQRRVALARKVRLYGILAELCQECRVLNKQFSELHGELVRIQLEVADNLKLIRWKLTEGDQTGKGEFHGREEGWEGELEFVEAIRRAAAEKCSLKVLDLVPPPIVEEPSSEEEGDRNRKSKMTPSKKLKRKQKRRARPRRGQESGAGSDSMDSCTTCRIEDLMAENGDKYEEEMAQDSDQSNRDPVDMEISDGGSNKGDDNDNLKMEAETTAPTPSTSTQVTPKPKKSNGSGESQKYKCPECCEHFDDLIYLRLHRTLHFGFVGNVYDCYECLAEFPQMAELKEHWETCYLPVLLLELKNPRMVRMVCHLCKKRCRTLKGLRRHCSRVHVLHPFSCGTCGKKFRSLEGMRTHQRDVHGRDNDKAERESSSKQHPVAEPDGNVQQGSSLSSSPSVTPTAVPKSSQALQNSSGSSPPKKSKAKDKESHLSSGLESTAGHSDLPKSIINPKSGIHKCCICSRTFASQFRFECHYKAAHVSTGDWNCEECGDQFPSRLSYLDHFKHAHMGRKWECYKCHQIFTRKLLLRLHKFQVCGEPVLHSPCSCLQCRREFSSAISCQNHVKVVHGRKELVFPDKLAKLAENKGNKRQTGSGPDKKKAKKGRRNEEKEKEVDGHGEGNGHGQGEMKTETSTE